MPLPGRQLTFALLAILTLPCIAHAQTYTETVLYNFCSGGSSCPDGSFPSSGLVAAPDGNYYGDAGGGGANGRGVIYDLTPSGTVNILHSFCNVGGYHCTDGSGVINSMVLGNNSILYGVTYAGGVDGAGTVFSYAPSAGFNTVYTFCASGSSSCPDGENPNAALVVGTGGMLYGTTNAGGNSTTNAGTVFSLTPGGTLVTLHTFCGSGFPCSDGWQPQGVALAPNGNLYGVTSLGGAQNYGVLFEVTPSGQFTKLYDFCTLGSGTNCPDGYYPNAQLAFDAQGNIYGTTRAGGTGNNNGTIFEFTTAGKLITIHNFCASGTCTDGDQPNAALVLGQSGNFYSTTTGGGANVAGTVFEMTPGGTLTTLYSFCSDGGSACTDGKDPMYGNLLQSADGSFYGTTVSGGANSSGVIYKLTPSVPSTSISLVAGTNPVVVGQSETLTATVSSALGTPTGTVSFSVNGYVFGSASLISGVAKFSAPTGGVSPGTYPVVAVYPGSSGFAGSQSAVNNITVNKAATTTSLSANPSSVTPPGSVMFTATVARTAPATGTPGGTVTFLHGSYALGTGTLNSSGIATLTKSSGGVSAGTYAVTAQYNGDGGDNASTSAAVNVIVQ